MAKISRTKLDKRKTRKTNKEIIALVNFLKKQKNPLWGLIAAQITKPRRKAVAVNLEKINKLSKGNEIVIVPGKILGKGKLQHDTVLIALKFSDAAMEKLAKSKKTNLMTIQEFIKKRQDLKGIPIKIIT